MFNCRVLPQLRQHYRPDQVASFERKCKEFAKELGLPEHEHHTITFPGFINWDNDKRHPWAKKRLTWPRVPDAELEALREEVCKDIFDKNLQQPQAAVNIADAAAVSEGRRARQAHGDTVQKLREHAQQTGIDRYQERLWRRALTQNEYICISPLQTMQSADCMPESNMPAEHAVRTVKIKSRALLNPLLPTDKIKSGKVVQDIIIQVVQKHLTGEKGKAHIRGSVDKMPLTFEILAGDEGHIVQLEYAMPDEEGAPLKRKHTQTWSVKCTGGKWIREKRWT